MKSRPVILLSFLGVYLSAQNIPIEADGVELPDLYSPVDDVIRLNATTFIPTVFHRNKNITYVVQFYNTFCGHCQNFAPVYKDLATRVRNWTSVVRIAGIDCSKDDNLNTCSENKIEGYPTILIFPPNAKVQDPNDAPFNLRKLPIEWTIDDIEETIVDYVANLTQTDRQHPLVANALWPVSVTNIRDFERLYTRNVGTSKFSEPQDLMFIVESDKSYIGRKLILEFNRINSKLELRRILTTNSAFLKSFLTSKDLDRLKDDEPLLVRVNNHGAESLETRKTQVLVRGEANHILTTSEESERHDFLLNRFKIFFEHFYSIELSEEDSGVKNHFRPRQRLENNEISNDQNNQLEIHYLIHNDPVGSKRIFATDLLKGISYMINHEIKIKGDLNPEEFTTVRGLLTIMRKYLPLEKWDNSFSKFIENLRTRLDDNRAKYETSGISAQEMSDILALSGSDQVRLRYSRENWVSCLDSDKTHKGYTCSLWLLFHSLTVGEYSRAAPVRVKSTMVLMTMRDYITKFLGCTVCSSNFKKETKSLTSSLISRNSSVLWLWDTHNHINQRINSELQYNRRPLVEVIFPAYHRCHQCIEGDQTDIGRDEKTLQDIRWNMANVFTYLLDIYRPDRIVSPKELAMLLNNIKKRVNYDLININVDGQARSMSSDMNRSVEQWDIFSASDMSLCFFLYLSCIIIVAVVCIALNPKWKKLKRAD